MGRTHSLLLLLGTALIVCGCHESPGSSSTLVTSEKLERGDEKAAEVDAGTAKPRAARADRIKEASFDDIKFEMEKTDPFKRELLTPKIEEMFGTRIRIRGWMLNTPREHGIKEFVLVRHNMECCFGPGAYLYDCMYVRMQGDATASFTTRQIAVEGRFRFEEFIDPVNGNHLAIYALDGERVR